MVRIHHIQPALPNYRVDFFDRLAEEYGARMVVHYTDVDMGALTQRNNPRWARPLGDFWQLPLGLSWQSGALAVPMRRGDIIVISGAPRCLSNLALLLKSRLRGARAVWWGHYWSSTSKRWRHMVRLFLMRASDALLFYTDQEVAEYQSGHKDRRPIGALNNGIDTTPIRLERKPYTAADRGDALLFIGRVTQKARLDLALSALAGLPDVALHIIGSGSVEQDLIRQASALGLAERVHWHGGMTNEAQIAAIAARCRAFLYPGPVGLSLIHAMAHGLPTLVHSDRWSNGPEIAAFEDGVTGLSFPPGDAKAMASTIRAALSDPEQLDAWSEEAIARTEDGFNTEDMARRFIALIDRLE